MSNDENSPIIKMDYLLRDVMGAQRAAREAWLLSTIQESSIKDSDLSQLSVLAPCGTATFIYPFHEYENLWDMAGIPCPFSFYWPFFNVERDVPYLQFVISVMQEQYIIWGADPITEESVVFVRFGAYLTTLNKLNAFSVCN